MKNIILFELNEVPWRILNDYINKFPNSSIAKVASKAQGFNTISEDTELSPWITWPTVHRGVSNKQHTISNFGQHLDEIDEAYPPVWQLIANRGNKVGVFGSLHTHPIPTDLTNYAFHIPDVFAAGSECFPKAVEAYQDWNLTMSRGSARNVSKKLPIAQTAKFLATLPMLGLKLNTALEIGRHLVDERKENWKVVRRRTQQVMIAFDVFMKQLESTKPVFTSFFTNHVASTMHRYWAAQFPDDYDEFGYSAQWQSTHRHEIDWTLNKFDAMLTRLLKFVDANPEYDIWIASSMGQAATRADNAAETQLYIDDLNAFMSYFNVDHSQYRRKPSMAPRIILEFNKEDDANAFAVKTKNVRIIDVPEACLADGENRALKVKDLGKNVFMLRVPIIQNHQGHQMSVDDINVDMSKLGLKHVRIADQSGQTAYHIPEGCLLRYSHTNSYKNASMETISTLDIAPMLLNNFAISVPDYMVK